MTNNFFCSQLRIRLLFVCTLRISPNPWKMASLLLPFDGKQETMVTEKKLVEEVSGWLRAFDDGSVDRTWTGPPAIGFLLEYVPSSGQFIDGVATRDVVVDQNSSLSIRIYLPETSPDDTKLPVLLHFHGGGFCVSEADWYLYHHFYTRLAKSARAVCVSVRLRRAPEHRLPAPFDDGFAALMWLRSLALFESSESWLDAHADFGRVFLIGDSAGGNVVHHVAARAGDEELAPLLLMGGILIHPGFVREERSKSELENESHSSFLTLEMVDKFLALALPIGSTKDHPFTCPMGEAAPPLAGLRLPDLLVCVAENDLMRDTQLEYYEEMKKAGKEVELKLSPGVDHCFYLSNISADCDPHTAKQTEDLISAVCDFIKKH